MAEVWVNIQVVDVDGSGPTQGVLTKRVAVAFAATITTLNYNHGIPAGAELVSVRILRNVASTFHIYPDGETKVRWTATNLQLESLVTGLNTGTAFAYIDYILP